MASDNMRYQPWNVQSIVEYASKLDGHTLREATGISELQDSRHRRGTFGNAVEEYYFGYKPNSDSQPDFTEANLELKTTPLRQDRHGRYHAKERLVLTMIDYMQVVSETFETSHLLDKASQILLVSYLWTKDANPIDYRIVMTELWGLPEEDMPQFKRDWETIVSKVRTGHAEDISGSDTLYLEACTKAANSKVRRPQPFSTVPAKPRAWALKASYMTTVENGLLVKREKIRRKKEEENLTLVEVLRNRFEPFFGLTENELALRFAISRSKDRVARITKAILGIGEDAEIDEFQKAGIRTKTIRLHRNGRPAEAVSFPSFDYFDLEVTAFEDSEFYEYLQQRWLFVLYIEDRDARYRLSNICLWQMPDSDIPEAKRCYEQMQENVRAGRGDVSVRSTENRCCHVRPHGRDGNDTRPQPRGVPIVKKSFWLNQGYLAKEISKTLEA